MSDSLRDQLIAAGYKAPKEEKKKQSQQKNNKKKKSSRKKARSKPAAAAKQKAAGKPANNDAQDDAAIEERKKLKAQIKTLIDEKKLDDWKGETVYRYLVDSRISVSMAVPLSYQEKLPCPSLRLTRNGVYLTSRSNPNLPRNRKSTASTKYPMTLSGEITQ